MTGQRPDTEQVIQNWLADSAPDRAPASLHETLVRETSRPAGQARPWPRFGAPALRFLGRAAAALAVLAIASSAAYFFTTSRAKPPALGASTSPANPSEPATGWHLVDPGFPKIGTDYQYYQPQVFGLASDGFVAFLSQAHGGDTAVYRSTDGTTWHEETGLPDKGATVASVAESGGRIVAVGFTVAAETETPMAWTTTDLRTWRSTVLPAPADTGAFKVVVGPAGFLAWGVEAMGPAEPYWMSSDGIAWKPVTTSPAGLAAFDLAATSDAYVMRVDANGLLSTWRSTDGIAWAKTWGTSAGTSKESYTMGPTIGTPGGGYISFGQDLTSASPAVSPYDWLVWTSSDLAHWTMSRIPAFGTSLGFFGSDRNGYVAAGSMPYDSGRGVAICRSDLSACEYGPLEVWTSSNGLNWQQVDGLSGITGLQVLTIASDGNYAIVVCRDKTDHVQLLVEAGGK